MNAFHAWYFCDPQYNVRTQSRGQTRSCDKHVRTPGLCATSPHFIPDKSGVPGYFRRRLSAYHTYLVVRPGQKYPGNAHVGYIRLHLRFPHNISGLFLRFKYTQAFQHILLRTRNTRHTGTSGGQTPHTSTGPDLPVPDQNVGYCRVGTLP